MLMYYNIEAKQSVRKLLLISDGHGNTHWMKLLITISEHTLRADKKYTCIVRNKIIMC